MYVVLLVIFVGIGAGSGWALTNFAYQPLPISLMTGALITLFLWQVSFLFRRSGKASKAFESRLAELETGLQGMSDSLQNVQTSVQKVTDKTETYTQEANAYQSQIDLLREKLNTELVLRQSKISQDVTQLKQLIGRLVTQIEKQSIKDTAASLSTASPSATSLSTASPSAASPPEPPKKQGVTGLASARKRRESQQKHANLLLQPITSLQNKETTYYEGIARLTDYATPASSPLPWFKSHRQADILKQIDNNTLFLSIQIVSRFAEKDQKLGVFCNVSRLAFDDQAFFAQWLPLTQNNQHLAEAIIFQMSAHEFTSRSEPMKRNMDRLRALGFRFSLSQVPDFAFDLPGLQATGVSFVKMRYQDMMKHLKNPKGTRPISPMESHIWAEDIHLLCARYGVGLIACEIDTAEKSAEIKKFGIHYGQGAYYGLARQVKASLLQETSVDEKAAS